MYRTIVVAGMVLAIAAMTSVARAESIAELLEKGIYSEETAGDLDKAISIYERVVAEARTSQLLAAKAQFHIGQCLLKKGKKAEATSAFEKLICSFPEAKELVAKARKLTPAGLPLEPVPWVDGETLQLRFRMATGLDIGTIVYTIQSAEVEGRKVWQAGSRTLVTLNNMNGMSSVDADWDSFRPIRSRFINTLMGDCVVQYSDNHATATIEGPDGKSTKKELDLSRVSYDNEEAMHVMRRLPLATGYKTTLPVLGQLGGGEIQLPLTVAEKRETVKVPAGEFECFSIHLGLVNQTFWVATDPHRYLVKFSANGVDAELTSIGQNKPGESRRYHDATFGFSLVAPNDWYFYSAPSLDKKHAGSLYLLDPQGVATCMLVIDKPEDFKGEAKDILRAWADAGNDELSKLKKDYKVRADAWQSRTIADLPALSTIADLPDGKRQIVHYCTYVEAKSAGLKLKFATSVPREKFDALRKSFDSIIDSLKVKQP